MEHTTVIITETTPGGGSRFYQEPGRPSSVDVDSLTPNTEYRADAEYESSDGTVIQSSNSMTFRTLPAGTFSISNEQWINNNDGQGSTLTFNFSSTYAISSIQVQVGGSSGSIYQCAISGNTATTSLPYFTPGTQRTMEFTLIDIYAEQEVIGRILTLQASMAETPFYVEADNPSNPAYVSLNRTGSPTSLIMQTSFDNSSWSNYTLGNSIELNESHPRVYFKNSSQTRFSTGTSNYYHITANGFINVGGNIASLKSTDISDTTSQTCDFTYLFYRNTYLRKSDKLYLGNYTTPASSCYANMFNGCTSLSTVPTLPATTLGYRCYGSMFQGCTSLTVTPTLPATTLASNCYEYMFYSCISLTTTPALPATTLANRCYTGMFHRCTGLTSAPSLPATTLADYCYEYMFYECTSLTTTPALPATTLASNCYSHMFDGCTSLTTVQTLSATTLANYCCQYMFRGCTSLTVTPTLPATTLANSCYYYMFYGCTSLNTVSSLPATTLADDCYTNMFQNCTGLTSVPELPATTLVGGCYGHMFDGCTSLENGPAIQATTLAQSCCSGMFNGCINLLTPPDLLATTLANSCYYGMFQGCTSLKVAPKLTAIRLTNQCYAYMFFNCSSLEEITCLAEDISATNCVSRWVERVAATGTFYKSQNMSSWPTGVSGIPTNWDVQDYQN